MLTTSFCYLILFVTCRKTDRLSRFTCRWDFRSALTVNISAPLRLDSYTSKPNNSPIWVVPSAVMGRLTWTCDRGSAKLEGPLQNYNLCEGAKYTAEERRLRSTKLM